MNQKTAERISNAILDYRDGESLLLLEQPLESAEISKKPDNKHQGLRITLAVNKRSQTLRNALNKVFNTLDEVAFDEKCVDYLEIVRVRADSKEEETIAVEVVEVTEKRSVWINE